MTRKMFLAVSTSIVGRFSELNCPIVFWGQFLPSCPYNRSLCQLHNIATADAGAGMIFEYNFRIEG